MIPIVAGIGNALLAVPMIRQLKRKRPDARVTILARLDAMADVFRWMPEVEETIVRYRRQIGVQRGTAHAGSNSKLRISGGTRPRREGRQRERL